MILSTCFIVAVLQASLQYALGINMNSYERVKNTILHQPADRVPCDFIAEDIVWNRMKEYFKVNTRDAVLDILDIDLRSVGPRYIGPELLTDEHGYEEIIVSGGPRNRKIYNDAGDYTTAIAYHPWGDIEEIGDLEGRTGWDGKMEWWDFSNIEEDIDRINENGRRWIKTHGDPSGLQHLTMWAGDEKFLCDLIADEELAVAMIEKHNEIRLEHALKTLEAGKGKIHELDGGGDYGSQAGLLISKEMFRKFFKDLYVKFYREIRKNFNVEIFFHSCGSIQELIPELVDVGVTILDPIQVSAKNMDIEVIKRRFGNQLTFHGGIDVQQVLPYYTIPELRKNVRNSIKVLGENGGYILAPTHNIQFDTKIENIIAMYEEAQNRVIAKL